MSLKQETFIGEEKFIFLDENKKYPRFERIKLFKKMSKMDPKTWSKSGHLTRIYGDIFVVNLNIYLIYRIYYRHCNPLLTIFQNFKNSNKIKFYFFSIAAFNFAYLYYSYKILPENIYDAYYSHLTDKQFIQLYNYLTNPDIKFFKG